MCALGIEEISTMPGPLDVDCLVTVAILDPASLIPFAVSLDTWRTRYNDSQSIPYFFLTSRLRYMKNEHVTGQNNRTIPNTCYLTSFPRPLPVGAGSVALSKPPSIPVQSHSSRHLFLRVLALGSVVPKMLSTHLRILDDLQEQHCTVSSDP